MPGDKNIRGPTDASRVNVQEDYEVRYWTNKFGCTKAELVSCVQRVGVVAADVKRCLGK
jgi:hypothetical protein